MVRIRVHYPGAERIVLRTSHDWAVDVAPTAVTEHGTVHDFEVVVPEARPLFYFKPCRVRGDRFDWAQGHNRLAGPGLRHGQTIHGHMFLPPGYDENTLKHYPVVYVHDGANVFFPEEAFRGVDWDVDSAVRALDAMNQVDKLVVVALYAGEQREQEYTAPGYHQYGRLLVDRVKPAVDARFRTRQGPTETAVMGSSLGGVVSLFLAWEHPEVFGRAACLSSTFSWRDDLLERIWREPRRNVRIYLDSGYPEDNWAVTREVNAALIARGWVPGRDLLHLAFPGALHHEGAWAQRVHLPLQFFFGDAFRIRPG